MRIINVSITTRFSGAHIANYYVEITIHVGLSRSRGLLIVWPCAGNSLKKMVAIPGPDKSTIRDRALNG